MSTPRYSIIPAAAVDDPKVSDLHLRILVLFGKASDNNGWLQVNQRLIAERTGRCRETINRAIRELVDLGYVRKKARFSGKDGRQLINDYQVVMDRADPRDCRENDAVLDTSEYVPCDVQITPPCDVQITGGVTSRDHTPCDLQRSHHKYDPLLQRPLSSFPKEDLERERGREAREGGGHAPPLQPADNSRAFEDARRAWPSGFADSREEAFAAWLDLAPAARQEAVDEIPRFVSTNRAVGRKLICSLAAYLRERKWEALPDKPAVASTPTPAGPAQSPPKAPKSKFLEMWDREHGAAGATS